MRCCDLSRKKKSKQYSTKFATFIRPRPSEQLNHQPTNLYSPLFALIYFTRSKISVEQKIKEREEEEEKKKNQRALLCYFLAFSLFDWKSSFHPLVFVSWAGRMNKKSSRFFSRTILYHFADFSVNYSSK